jgi:tetratricopeptide (TPR) repeat protein
LSVLLSTQFVVAQEPFKAPEGIPPESDWVYRKHYAEVQKIMAVSDLSKRQAQLETYMKKLHPKSKILQYMESFFGQILQAYKKAGKDSQAQALTQKMAKLFPDSGSLLPQQFQSAFEKKNYAAAIPLGEKLLARNPNDAQLSVMLAQSYLATNNTAKVARIAPKIVQLLGPKKGVYYVAWLSDYYRNQRDTAKAATYCDMLLKAYPTGRPQGWEANRWNSVKANAYTVRASNSYVNKNYRAAIQDYAESLKYAPGNDAAYLYIGLSHWRLQELDQAQDSLAKAVVLGKTNSAKARQYLEQVYKPRNNDSLDGLDDVLAKAKAELKL